MGRFFAFTVSLLAFSGCAPQKKAAEVRFAATVPPLGMILREVAKGRAEVVVLVDKGASPHTFEPTPAVVAAAHSSLGLFQVGKGLDDWAQKLEGPTRVEAVDLIDQGLLLRNLEEHTDEPNDPHFWMDPVLVKSIVPKLAAKLIELDPAGRSVYEANASVFAAKLERLDSVVRSLLKPVIGRPLVLIHPSMQYLAKRYGLKIAAIVEPSPGKEPTTAQVSEVLRLAKASGAKTVFTEPQLPRKDAEQIASLGQLKLGELDPVGGVEGRDTYEKLILHNARQLMSYL